MSSSTESMGTITREADGRISVAITAVPGRDGMVRLGGPATIRVVAPYLETALHVAADGRALVRRARCVVLDGRRAEPALMDAQDAVVSHLRPGVDLVIDGVAVDHDWLAAATPAALIATLAPGGAAERRAVA